MARNQIKHDDAKSDCGKSNAPDRKSRPEVPSEQDLFTFNLRDGYRIKYCKLCDLSSISKSPLTDPSLEAAWMDMLPWGNGTRVAPTGVYCRWGGGG